MTSRLSPLVSVVTPVYNGERYLRECIESVLSQSYTHWDYTIVNNCSTDRTLDIAREYAVKDSRIRIHSNETFVRVIKNYNIAFRQISPESKYCKVVAADDCLFPECLERMVRLAEEHPNVAVVSAYGLEGARVVWPRFPYPSTIVPGREACRMRLLEGANFFGTPTSVLFRSDMVRSRHAFQNESNLHADSEAYLECLEHHDFGFVHQVLTFRRDDEGSLTSFSKGFNTYLACNLYELVTYGPKYLKEEELKQRLREHLRDYYRYLAREVYKRRGKKFWTFHREKLAVAGHPLSMPRLVLSALSYALDLLLNPKRTATGVIARARRISAQWLTHLRQSIADDGPDAGKGRGVPGHEEGTPHPRPGRAVAER
jgi:glycosyltransferase involved in cell wall biosynthesis